MEFVVGCLAEIREAQRQWGMISLIVENGKVKFVNVQKPPKYKLEDGSVVEVPRYPREGGPEAGSGTWRERRDEEEL